MREKMIDNKPRLVVREGVMQPQIFEVDQSVIEDMIMKAIFAMPVCQVVVSHKLAVVDAILRLDSDDGHSISGFPRSLVKQETRAMSKWARINLTSRLSDALLLGHRAALLARRMAAAQSDNSSIYSASRTTRSWRPPGSDRTPSDHAPSERAPSIMSETLSSTTATFSLRSGMSSPIGRYPSGASLATTVGGVSGGNSLHGDADRPNLARNISKASALSSDSHVSLNDTSMPNSTPRGYFSTVAQPPPGPSVVAARQSSHSHHFAGSINTFADQSRYSAGGVPLPQMASPTPTPVSPPRKEYSLIPKTPRNNPPFSPTFHRKEFNTFPLPQRNTTRSPTITEGLYELDGNPRNRGISVRESLNEGEVHDQVLVNPYMKPETTKDKILKEVRDAKDRVRQEEVAPLEERLRALEAMVLQMSKQGNER